MDLRTAWLGSLLLVGACGDPLCGPARPCEVQERGCQDQALEIAACYMETEARERASVRVRSVDQLVREREDAREDRDEAQRRDAEHWRRGLSLMALTVADESPEERDRYQLANFSGWYDASAHEITVRDDLGSSRPGQALLLVHEFVHALQAERTASDESGLLTTDAQLARGAMLEGEARLYETFASAEGHGFALDDLRDRAFQDVPARLWSPRPIDDAYDTFTYRYGARWAVAAWREGGAQTVADEVTSPPRSTRHVMAGHGSRDPVDREARRSFESRAHPVLPERYRLVDHDTLGAWILTHYDAEGWVGDRFHVFHDDEADDTVAVWRMRFERRAQAVRVRDAIVRSLDLEDDEVWDRADEEDEGPPRPRLVIDGRTLSWIESTGRRPEVTRWTSEDEEAQHAAVHAALHAP